jgi:hypothetical protein
MLGINHLREHEDFTPVRLPDPSAFLAAVIGLIDSSCNLTHANARE